MVFKRICSYTYFIIILWFKQFGYKCNERYVSKCEIFDCASLDTWSMGLGVRYYLNNVTKDLRDKFKNAFLATTLMSWGIVLILFTII